MSGTDQPLVIANSCYHVGHERSVRVAEEQGFFKEEGLERYVVQKGGLIPVRWEFDGLGQQMWERGVDIATAVDVRSAIVQRARGEDVYIVGGWRTQLAGKLIGAQGITGPEQLRGGRTATREARGLVQMGIQTALLKYGVQPGDIEWIEGIKDPEADERGADLLRSGRISFLSLNGGTADREADRLISDGYPLVLDLEGYYRGRGPWPPGSVIVATKQTVEERGEELRAFLRANLHAYWFIQDPANQAYMYDLETRMRQDTFNAYERKIRLLRSPNPAPREGSMMTGAMVMDGGVHRGALATVIEEWVQSGEIEQAIPVDDVLKDAPVIDAFNQLLARGVIRPERLAQWRAFMGYPG